MIKEKGYTPALRLTKKMKKQIEMLLSKVPKNNKSLKKYPKKLTLFFLENGVCL